MLGDVVPTAVTGRLVSSQPTVTVQFVSAMHKHKGAGSAQPPGHELDDAAQLSAAQFA
jgi:hypothetical protein